MNNLTLVCPCLFGLESVLAGEIKRLGGQHILVSDDGFPVSGTTFDGRANIMLRIAERVLIELGSFRAESFSELFDNVSAMPFENFIGSKDAFPVKGWSLNSKLHSVPDCQSIIKKPL
jgi:putative N6-adenine-specific DNA methylase